MRLLARIETPVRKPHVRTAFSARPASVSRTDGGSDKGLLLYALCVRVILGVIIAPLVVPSAAFGTWLSVGQAPSLSF